MPANTPKQRLLRLAVLAGIVLLLIVGYGIFYNVTGYGFPCMIYQITGLQCAGCGLTRALAAVLQLDLVASFSYNPVWPLYVGYFAWIGVAGGLAYVRRGAEFHLPGKTWIHICILVAAIAFGVLRNFI